MKTKITILALSVLAGMSFAAGPQYSDWSQPVNLGPVINTGYNDQQPAISKDGLSLYISSDQHGPLGLPTRERRGPVWTAAESRADH